MSDQFNNQNPGGDNASQTPYGQQGAPDQQYTQGQYGQPSQPSPYGAPQGPYPPSDQQQWAQGQPAYGAPYAYAPPPTTRSNVMGIVGLGIVVVSIIALVMGAFSFGQGLGQYVLDVAASGAIVDEQALMDDPMTQLYAESAAGTIILIVLACIAGFAGWIVSIIATVQRRGRPFGIGGIVLGVLSLGFGYAALMAALAPVLAQISI
ncbi:hypothetical protein [Tessaracoccus sp.]